MVHGLETMARLNAEDEQRQRKDDVELLAALAQDSAESFTSIAADGNYRSVPALGAMVAHGLFTVVKQLDVLVRLGMEEREEAKRMMEVYIADPGRPWQHFDWQRRYEALLSEGPPDECTRQRMKPYMDDCECEWCQRLNELLMDRPRTIPGDES